MRTIFFFIKKRRILLLDEQKLRHMTTTTTTEFLSIFFHHKLNFLTWEFFWGNSLSILWVFFLPPTKIFNIFFSLILSSFFDFHLKSFFFSFCQIFVNFYHYLPKLLSKREIFLSNQEKWKRFAIIFNQQKKTMIMMIEKFFFNFSFPFELFFHNTHSISFCLFRLFFCFQKKR